MAAHLMARENKDGSATTYCGITYPKGQWRDRWLYWGHCPACVRARKQQARR